MNGAGPSGGYDDLNELYGRLIGQWRTELTHVTNVVGGAESQEKYGSQKGVRFTPVPKARQQAAVKFLNENAFATPTYFLDQDILRKIEPTGSVPRILAAQSGILSSLLQPARLIRLAEHDGMSTGNAYSMPELFDDLRHGLFSELASGAKIDVYRRALQRAYVENLNLKLNPPAAAAGAAGGRGGGGGGGRPQAPALDPKMSDINGIVRAELKALDAELKAASGKSTDRNTKAHMSDLRHRIADAIKGKAGAGDEEG